MTTGDDDEHADAIEPSDEHSDDSGASRRKQVPPSEPVLRCSFCGKDQKEVAKLIAGPTVYICNECVELCRDIIDEELSASAPNVGGVREELAALAAALDDAVVGQMAAKRAVMAAWIQRNHRPRDMPNARAPRVLLVGPTGVGKSTLGRALCGAIGGVADVGRLSETGYAGQDVDGLLHGFIDVADRGAALQGAPLVLDGLEKLRAERPASGGRDINGEGAQRELLALLEGTVIHLPSRSGRFHDGTRPHRLDAADILVVALFRSEGDPPAETTERGLRDHLRARGLIAPLLARFDRVVWMPSLTIDEAQQLLEGERGLLANAYQIAKRAGRALVVEPEAIRALAGVAVSSDSGGWALRQVVERMLEDTLLSDGESPPTPFSPADVERLLRS